MNGWKMKFLLGWPVFRCYVSFWECMGWRHLMAVQNLTKSVSVIELVSQTSGNNPAKIVCNHLCTMTIMERKSIVKTKMAYVFRLCTKKSWNLKKSLSDTPLLPCPSCLNFFQLKVALLLHQHVHQIASCPLTLTQARRGWQLKTHKSLFRLENIF